MSTSLRDLLIAVKVKVDKTGLDASNVALKETTVSASSLEKMLLRVAAAHQKFKVAQAKGNAAADESFAKMLGFSTKARPVAPRKDAPKIDNTELLAATFAKPKTALERLRDSAKSALASVGADLKSATDKVDAFASKIFTARHAVQGFAAVIVARAVGEFIGSVVEAGGALSEMSQRTRVSVESLQAWKQLAADSGIESGVLESSFRKLSKSMRASEKPTSTQAVAFKALGVDAQNASKTGLRPVEDVMIDVGAALNAMEDDATATALATQLLGPAGYGLVPAFDKGEAAVRKYLDTARESASISTDEAARLDEVGDATGRATKKWTGLKNRLVVAILPVLEFLSVKFEKVSKWLLQVAKQSEIFHTILGALAAGGLLRVVMLLGTWVTKVGGARAALALFGNGLRTAASFALRFIAPLLIIEDFLTFLAGGKSLFGRAFNEIFGEGGAKKVRDGLLNVFSQLKRVIDDLSSAITGIGSSDLFTGLAKVALDTILLVLNAIGAALNSNTDKANAFAAALGARKAKLTKDVGTTIGHKPGDELPTIESAKPTSFVEKLPGFQWLKRKVQSDPVVAAENARNNRQRGSHEEPAPIEPNASLNPNAGVNWLRNLPMKPDAPVPTEPAATTDPNAGVNWLRNVPIPQTGTDGIKNSPVPQGAPIVAGPVTNSRSVTLNDHRVVEVNVSSTDSPGATGRAVASNVSVALDTDTRQTLSAVSE